MEDRSIVRNKQEYILCAAIWYSDLPLKKPEILESRGFSPYNVDSGVIFCGWRHYNCICQMAAVTGLDDSAAGHGKQGFLTSKNRFVDRAEAAKIAYVAGQIEKPHETLFSEDLY